MGSLKELRIPEEAVETPGGDLTVRGVSLQDITSLVRHHGPALALMFKDIMSGKDVTLSVEALVKLGQNTLTTAPQIVAELIALSAGDGDAASIKIASRLPLPVQIEAVEKIAMLTFPSEGGLPKLVETVIRIAQGTSGVMLELQKPSTNGSGMSASM